MDDPIEHFLSAQRAFGDRVHAVAEAQWGAVTPDEDWTVADLVGHLVDEHRWAAPLVHGQDLDTARLIVAGARPLPVDGGIGANLAESWDEAAVGSADAFVADGALDRTVRLSRGVTPARDYLEELFLDLVVHAWDLGTAIGYSGALPDDLVTPALELARTIPARYPDMFAAPVEVPSDAAPADRLAALTGRTPR